VIKEPNKRNIKWFRSDIGALENSNGLNKKGIRSE
jgi:hypothetical protein